MAEKIEIYPVASSNLSGLGHNPAKSIAAVRFKSGEIFHYAGASLEFMERWLQSESLGRFYAENVRGKLPGQKMTGHCPDCGAMGWVGDKCEDCGCSNYAEDPRKGGENAKSGTVRTAGSGVETSGESDEGGRG